MIIKNVDVSDRLYSFVDYLPGMNYKTVLLLKEVFNKNNNFFDSYYYISDNIFEGIFSIKEDFDGYIIINDKQKMKFGRFIANIAKKYINLSTINISKEIEYIINNYKSWVNLDQTLTFKFLEGDDIIDGYKYHRQIPNRGSLYDSCMNNSDKVYFYTKIKDCVKLLVLVDSNEKVHGRALVWKLSNKPYYFMDRVYARDIDVLMMFEYYAKKNKYASRTQELKEFKIILPEGQIVKRNKVNFKIDVNISKYKKELPYIDTMCFLSHDKQVLSNKVNFFYSKYYRLDNTRGRLTKIRKKILGMNF